MNAVRAGLACSLVSLLAACGGGGGDSGTAGTAAGPVTNTPQNTYPATRPGSGDWYVYANTTQQTLPATAATEGTLTRYFRSVASDGAMQRVQTGSDLSQSTRHYDAVGAITSFESATSICEYNPGYRFVPLPGTAAGTTYTSTTRASCRGRSATSSPTVDTITVAGKAEGLESHTTPLGTFQTFKRSHTITTVYAAGDTSVTNETCWDDVTSGNVVECQSTSTNTAKGATAPRTSNTAVIRLIAQGRNGQAPQGPAVRRFAGAWTVQFSGDDTGTCSNVRVAADGSLSGACAFGGMVSFGVTGRITDSGAVTVNVDNGAQLIGTAGTPLAASGTWTLGNLRGSWTASHQ
jgi:hypothetical protein